MFKVILSADQNHGLILNNGYVKRQISILHLALHFLIPMIAVGLFYRKQWKVAYLIMMATMLIDLDHLHANPIYDASRCSIGFHPLHGIIPIGIYCLLCFFPKTRIVGIGLVIHMILDSIDCQVTVGVWSV